MAEIEHFVDPQNKSHPKFKKYKHVKLPLYSACHQYDMKEYEWMEIG
jgi:glycyl-tRNA synthetase (class II)